MERATIEPFPPEVDRVVCANCGHHRLTRDALKQIAVYDPVQRARVAFGLRKVDADTVVKSYLIQELEKAKVPIGKLASRKASAVR